MGKIVRRKSNITRENVVQKFIEILGRALNKKYLT